MGHRPSHSDFRCWYHQPSITQAGTPAAGPQLAEQLEILTPSMLGRGGSSKARREPMVSGTSEKSFFEPLRMPPRPQKRKRAAQSSNTYGRRAVTGAHPSSVVEPMEVDPPQNGRAHGAGYTSRRGRADGGGSSSHRADGALHHRGQDASNTTVPKVLQDRRGLSGTLQTASSQQAVPPPQPMLAVSRPSTPTPSRLIRKITRVSSCR